MAVTSRAVSGGEKVQPVSIESKVVLGEWNFFRLGFGLLLFTSS